MQALQRIDIDGDGTLGPTESARYRASECPRLVDRLELSLGGRSVPLAPAAGSVRLLPGQGGLHTLRLECPSRGPAVLGDSGELAFQDRNFPDRIGWREISLAGDGTIASYTVIRVAPARHAGDAPYAIAVVKLREGVSLMGRVVDVPLDQLAVGLPVRFRPVVSGEQTTVAFGPA